MRDIIQKLLATSNSKERSKLLEEFRNFQFKGKREEVKSILFEIFKEAKQMLENTVNDEEKIISLRVLGAIFLIYPHENMAEMLGVKPKETLVKDFDIMELIDLCLDLLENKNGNLRLSSAYLIDHLRGHLSNYNYVDLFYNLLSLKNSPKNKGKNKKTIEFCINKLSSPFLEGSLEILSSPEIRKMKINVYSKNKESINFAKMIETISNQMIAETQKYIKRILSLRGKSLLEGNFIPYIENIGILQIIYELQRLKEIKDSEKITPKEMVNYLVIRLLPFMENRLKMLNNLPQMEEFSIILLSSKGMIKIATLQDAYGLLENAKLAIEKLL